MLWSRSTAANKWPISTTKSERCGTVRHLYVLSEMRAIQRSGGEILPVLRERSRDGKTGLRGYSLWRVLEAFCRAHHRFDRVESGDRRFDGGNDRSCRIRRHFSPLDL